MVFSRGRLPEPRRAPAVGEADAALLADWARPRPAPSPPGTRRLPLDGLRVADFTWMLAGPLASRFLADLGADVIRIESHVRRDLTREIGTQPPGFQSLDTNSHQHQAGCNKRSLALDLRQPGAIAVAKQLIATADIVLDNYRPGTMVKWGLSPQELLAEWPRLIVATMPAVGTTGPRNQYGAVGNGIAAYAGVNSMTGFAENPPFGVGPIIGDFFAPLFTAQAILSAYHHLQVTGEGQHVDCPMFESCLWLLDTAFADLQLNGWVPERIGNRHERFSPHGLFPCAADDEWIAVAVTTDGQWRALASVLGFDEATTERFAGTAARKADEAALEELVAGRTAAADKWALALELQRAGVAAAPVEHVVDHLQRDRGLADRFTLVEHPYGPTFYVQNQFIRPEGVMVENRRSPMIGEHSDDVLRELGLGEDTIADLWVKGIIN
jgi:benzylsuccinate CoA-transferase BbsF subunit